MSNAAKERGLTTDQLMNLAYENVERFATAVCECRKEKRSVLHRYNPVSTNVDEILRKNSPSMADCGCEAMYLGRALAIRKLISSCGN